MALCVPCIVRLDLKKSFKCTTWCGHSHLCPLKPNRSLDERDLIKDMSWWELLYRIWTVARVLVYTEGQGDPKDSSHQGQFKPPGFKFCKFCHLTCLPNARIFCLRIEWIIQTCRSACFLFMALPRYASCGKRLDRLRRKRNLGWGIKGSLC